MPNRRARLPGRPESPEERALPVRHREKEQGIPDMRKLFLLLALILCVAGMARADTLSGTVVDQNGNRVAGARVTVCSTGSTGIPCTPVLQTTFTATDGTYLATIAAGTYDITIERTGIVSTKLSNIATSTIPPYSLTIANLIVTETGTLTGRMQCKNFENAFCIDPANSQSWTGTDIGGWFNSLYGAFPSRGGKGFLGPALTGLSMNYSTPITFNTVNKYAIFEGLAPAGGGDTSNPGGATLNYTPTTTTSAVTLDWAKFPTADSNPGAGLRDFGLVNNNCNKLGGCGSSAIGLDIGPTNGGANDGEFRNLLVQGFGTGERINGTGQSWGMNHYNSIYKYNKTGVSIPSAEETEDWFGSIFILNGQGVSLSGSGATAKFFGAQFDSNNSGAFSCSGGSATSGMALPHFENLGMGSTAPNYLSGSCNLAIFGGDALDDTASGTTATLLGTMTGGLWIEGMALGSAGRTYTTGVVGVSGAAHLGFIVSNGAGVSQPCPVFGTSTNCEVIDPRNLGGLGVAYFNTPNLGLNTTSSPLHFKASNGSGGNTVTWTASGNSNPTLPTATGNVPLLPTVTTTETGSGAVVKATSPALVTPSIGGTTITNVPVITYMCPVLSVAARTNSWCTFTPTFGITVVRVEVRVQAQAAGCTTSPKFGETGGSSATVTLPNASATADSGAISVNFAAGTPINFGTANADVGCGTQPVSVMISVQYKMQ
jgi:hypothetical protein